MRVTANLLDNVEIVRYCPRMIWDILHRNLHRLRRLRVNRAVSHLCVSRILSISTYPARRVGGFLCSADLAGGWGIVAGKSWREVAASMSLCRCFAHWFKRVLPEPIAAHSRPIVAQVGYVGARCLGRGLGCPLRAPFPGIGALRAGAAFA